MCCVLCWGQEDWDYLRAPLELNFPSVHRIPMCLCLCVYTEGEREVCVCPCVLSPFGWVFVCRGGLCVSMGGGSVSMWGMTHPGPRVLLLCVCVWVFIVPACLVVARRQLQPISGNTLNGSRTGSAPSRAVTQPSSTARQPPQPPASASA